MPHRNCIGVDLGGTKCTLARISDDTFDIEASVTIPTRATDGFEEVLKDIEEKIGELRTSETRAIGMGVPGLVSKNILLKAPNIAQSTNIPVKEILEKKLKLPVSLCNDAQCFTLAEATMGSAKGKHIVVGITFGTGVGGGITIGGKPFEGAHGYAGEIGHMLMMPGQPPYETDDKRGEVEQFLSGTAMGKRCEEAQSPEDYLEGAVCSFMQPDIYREVAWLCTNLHFMFDPDIIVFGGSAGHALSKHIKEIEGELKQWMLPGSPLPSITAATMKNAGVIGAALLTVS